MNTLRVKITTLVVAAILIVIALAVWLFFVIHPYPPPAFKRVNDIHAYYLSVILRSGADSSYREVGRVPSAVDAGRFKIRPEPASGEIWGGMIKELRSALRRQGISASVIVSRTSENYWPVASIAFRTQAGL